MWPSWSFWSTQGEVPWAEPRQFLYRDRETHPDVCQPHQGSGREILAHATVVATGGKYCLRRHLEMGRRAVYRVLLKFPRHTSWTASGLWEELGVQSGSQGSVTICQGCTLAFQARQASSQGWTQMRLRPPHVCVLKLSMSVRADA